MIQPQNQLRYANEEDLSQQYTKLELIEAQKRIEQHITLMHKQKKRTDSNNILACLKNHFIFYNLSQAELENVKDHMFYCEVQEGTTIFTQRDQGTCFFIVIRGSLELLSENKSKRKVLKNNDGFGELALLYRAQRNCEVTALEDTSLWVIDRITFRHAVQEMIIKEYTQNKKCFESVRFFANLTPDQKDIIASSLIRQKFYKGQNIIQEGDPGSTFYYIKEGNASVYKGTRFQRKLTKGDSFGEQSLYYNTMRQYTIKADQDVVCLVLGRDTLNKIMGENIYQVTFKNFIRWAFEKNATISQLTKETQEKIIDQMKISSYKAQQPLFKRGVVGFQKLVVVIEGSLKKLKNGAVVAAKGQCYGQQFLKDPNKILDDQVIMQNYGVVAEILEQDFKEAVQKQSYHDLIALKREEHENAITKLETTNLVRKDLQDRDIKTLRVANMLSAKGQFGPLFLVKHQGKQYVLKAIEKQELEKYDVCRFAVEQGKVLEEISCPFIVAMGRKFQSSNYLYYLHECVRGRDLYDILKSIGLLSTDDSQFFTASIILILEYLASKGIICRDVKPENFMVDAKGYLKMINLPTAKLMERDGQGNFKKTYTIIGTPHYMAPDIVIGKGYNNLVDLWSLGICLYEFLCGVLPFGDASESAYEIYEEIMQTELKFPEFLHDKKAKKLIEQLLSHNPSQRLGGSFENLKRHPWFSDFKWESLLNGKMTPPKVPSFEVRLDAIMDRSLQELVKQLQKQKSVHEYDSKWDSFDRIFQ